MKLLLTVLLLVHTIQCLPEFSRDACLQSINTARAEVAEKFQIANMNSLKYNKKLEPVILQQLSFVDGCPKPSIISHKSLDVYLNVHGQNDLVVELLSGTNHTVLACVKSKCNGEDIVSIVTDKIDSIPIAGAPGTKCPSDSLAGPNGLCVLENGKNSRRGFTDLDEIARDIAKVVEKALKGETDKEIPKVFVKTARIGVNGNSKKYFKTSGSSRRGFLKGLLEIFKDVNPPPYFPREDLEIDRRRRKCLEKLKEEIARRREFPKFPEDLNPPPTFPREELEIARCLEMEKD
ncbi:hypothetical protein CAEBREN_22423 [Caenorhabditis brenneri]|uniref:Uncharacterized protein n=1 Tax=Caenorhabditis brenneri TaxID=135651 RepID=G0MD38_CAEBE|nr:hypothetical protein CAEBREN_22423 [Caenorhabditis brenneri]